MNNRSHIKHTVSVVLGLLIAIVTPALTSGVLANYSWTPLALAAVVYAGRILKNMGGGPPAVAVLALFVTLGSFGCWLTKPQPISPTVPDGGFADASAGQTFVDCSEAALHDAWVSLLPDIETAAAVSPASIQAVIATVAATAGMPLALAEGRCALQYLVDRITHSQKTAPDSLEATKLANAQAWLAAHP